MHNDVVLGRLEKRLPDTKKIAVLRANGIGDYLFAEPALAALEAAYPEAELVLVGSPWHARELPERPGPVDRVVVAPPSPGIREPADGEAGCASAAEREGFFAAMRAERFDLAVQLHGGGLNSNPFVRAFGARLTVGSHTPDADELDRSIPFYYFRHEVLRFLEVACLAGAPPVRLSPTWTVTGDDDAAARAVMREGGVEGAYAVLSPGAGDPRRRWPAESFARIADWLAGEGLGVVMAGSTGDRPLVRRVCDESRGGAVDMAGRLGLGGLAALMRGASVVVANDSGPLHLARAVGTPTTGVYWCGNVINAAPLAGADHQIAISWRLMCRECGADCTTHQCDHTSSFVDDVSVAEVRDRTSVLLRRGSRQGTKLE